MGKLRKHRVIVEPDPNGGLLAMDETGQVHYFRTPGEVVRWSDRRDKRGLGPNDGTMTILEWRGGCAPPSRR